MKKLIVLSVIIFSAYSSATGQNKLVGNYIQMTYGGPRNDRNIVDVFLSYKKLDPAIYSFGVFYKIRKRDFIAVWREMEKSKNIENNDSATFGYFRIILNKGENKRIFIASNRKKISEIFAVIEKQLHPYSTRNYIKEALDVVFSAIDHP